LTEFVRLLRLLIDDRGPKNPMPALKFAFSLPRFCPVVLVGTMCDRAKERAVAASEAEDFSKKHGIPYFETSAFMNVNVENVYFEAVRQGRTMLKEIATEREEKKTTQCSCM
jgi:Fe2+ transport system protein B